MAGQFELRGGSHTVHVDCWSVDEKPKHEGKKALVLKIAALVDET